MLFLSHLSEVDAKWWLNASELLLLGATVLLVVGLIGDRIWSQTLTAVEATSDPDKIHAMFTRAGLAMEIAVDMRGWPQHVSGL